MIDYMRPMALVGRDNPVLNGTANEVEKIDETVELLIARLTRTCQVKRGLAIAAPQVGVPLRVIVDHEGHAWINPVVNPTGELELCVEGCLSLPGRTFAIERATSVHVEALDVRGDEVSGDFDGIMSQMFQHEVDHLNGLLISRGTLMRTSGLELAL